MPRRYYPRNDQLSPLSVVAAGLEGWEEGRMEKRRREDEDEARSLGEALQALQLDQLGLREGTAPTRQVPVEDSIFQDQEIGMARGAPGPSGLGMSLEAARRMGPTAFRPQPDQDEVVHPAGSFIRGVGFTEKSLTRGDLVEATKRRAAAAAGALDVADPTKRQLTDEYYLDETATPEARQARSGAARQLQTLSAFRRLGASPEQLQLLEADPDFADEVYAQLSEEPDGPTMLGGALDREFPDTPEGRAAALAWEGEVAGSRREPDQGGSSGGPSNAQVRQAVHEGAAALRAIDEEIVEAWVQAEQSGTLDKEAALRRAEQLQATANQRKLRELQRIGFRDQQHYEDMARESLTGSIATDVPRARSQAPSAPVDGTGGDVTDEQIAQWVDEGLTDEEILARIEAGGT